MQWVRIGKIALKLTFLGTDIWSFISFFFFKLEKLKFIIFITDELSLVI
jgi:hypothetical protein